MYDKDEVEIRLVCLSRSHLSISRFLTRARRITEPAYRRSIDPTTTPYRSYYRYLGPGYRLIAQTHLSIEPYTYPLGSFSENVRKHGQRLCRRAPKVRQGGNSGKSTGMTVVTTTCRQRHRLQLILTLCLYSCRLIVHQPMYQAYPEG